MDALNLQPDALGVPDSTFEVEGYEDHVEEIENAYPEEDFRTPAEQAAEEQVDPGAMQQASDEAFQEGSVAQEQPLDVAEQPSAPEQVEQPVPEEAPQPMWSYDEEGNIPIEQLQEKLGNVPEGVVRKLALQKDWDEAKEGRLRELFEDGNNLEAQLEAFKMIRDDPELVARYDHNEDGEITYDDFFDTTNDPDWSDEKDAQLTEEWLAG